MSYSIWLKELTNYFFGAHMSKQRVRLMVDGQFLDSQFHHIGGCDSFIKAINDGPEWLNFKITDLNRKVQNMHKQWVNKELRPHDYPDLPNDPPPFIPYLCLMSLAWTIEKNQGNNFYDRLASLYQGHGLGSKKMKFWSEKLWIGLEEWSQLKNEELGIFKVEQLGKMKYVGIPKAQVILPWHKLAILPDLLWRCHLNPKDSSDLAKVRERLLDAPATHQYLPHLLDEIENKSAIGLSAIGLIGEYLEGWDGEPNPSYSKSHGNTYKPSIVQILRLSDSDNVYSWHPMLGISDEKIKPISGAEKLDSNLYKLSSQVENKIESHWKGSVDVELSDGESHTFQLSHTPRGISIFPTANMALGQLFIESEYLPDCGTCYFLIAPQCRQVWDAWKQQNQDVPVTTDLPSKGLPDSWKLECIEDIEKHSASFINSPLADARSQTPRLFRLIGGSRIQVGLRKTYLAYDLPVIETSSEDIQFEVTGADLIKLEDTGIRSEPRLPTTPLLRYKIKADPDSEFITVNAQCSDLRQNGSFGVARHGQADLPSNTKYALNQKGSLAENTDDAFLLGIKLYKPESEHVVKDTIDYPRLGIEDSLQAWSDISLESNAFRFLESIASTGGKLSISEFRRRSEYIGRIAGWEFNSNLRLMRDLGYVEIALDSSARWVSIHNSPPAINLLPQITRDGRNIGSITGVFNRNLIDKLIADSKDLGIELMQSDNDTGIVPRSIFLVTNDSENLALLADEHNLAYSEKPPSIEISEWSASLYEWENSIADRLRHGTGHEHADSTYSPERFKFVSGSQVGPLKLQRFNDPITGVHRIFRVLYDHPNSTHGPGHFLCKDQSWAKWACQNRACSEEWITCKGPKYDNSFTPVIYDPDCGTIYLHQELLLPRILMRALTLASSLPPQKVRGRENPYYDLSGNFNDAANTGLCAWKYTFIPDFVCKTILSKVSAIPIERKYLIVNL